MTLTNMESFLNDVKKKVQCSLCKDTLIEPKILKCFHTICKPCIKRHTELIKEANIFKCPECSSETCLPKLSSVDDLQPSTLHSRILKSLSMVESEKVCSVSESHSPASWYCFDCDHSLCLECRNYHSFFTKDHKLVRLADLKREDFDLIISRENHCENHPNQRLDLCCEDCDVLICVTCLKQAHRHHKTITLDEFASVKKALLLKHLQVLEHLRLDDKEKQEQQDIAYRITQEGEKAIKEVKDKTKEMIEILQENERELLRQIDSKLYTAKTNLNIIHHIPAVNEYINNVMERGLASEMVNIQETECSEKFIFNFIPPYAKITFVPNEELMKQVNSGLGEIQTKRTDHEMRSILVETESKASKKNKLFSTTELLTGEFEMSTDEESTEEIDFKLFQTVPIILEFFFTVQKYKKRIEAIESEFSVKICGAENGSKVGIYPTARCSQPKYDDACEEYIKLYREITDGNMMSKELVLKPGYGSLYLSADEAVKEVLQETPVVIQKLEEPDTWLFYGEDSDVRLAIKDVCKELKIDNPFRKARKTIARPVLDNGEGAGATVTHLASWVHEIEGGDQLENPNDPKSPLCPLNKDLSVSNDMCLKILTKKGFQLSVQQGDITQEHVDVIINSIDEYLSFLYGLPASLVQMGGSSIEKEAVAESRRKKTKPGGLIMTGPGKLHCLKIIHILTWKFSKKNSDVCKRMVKESCLASLKRTEREKLKSIAFPAVGSGQQGMPLDICATAMVNAVEEYMKVSDPKRGAVADIRFVYLDPYAVEVFEAELTKRYGDSISASTARSDTRQDKYKIRTLPDSSSADKKTTVKDEDDVCAICLDGFHNPVTLQKCNHQFCSLCIDKAFKNRRACPTCGMSYVQTGNMPHGKMSWRSSFYRLPGYEKYGAIEITYQFPSGTQGPEHPNPGQYYHGTSRMAYLPDCPEGREVLDLLKKAFHARLTFTIGTSVTSGASNVVTWNDIHHKTNPYGGATNFGYPDPTYLQRVKAELAAKGIS